MNPSADSPSLAATAARDLARLRAVAFIVARHGFSPLLMKVSLGRRLLETPVTDDPALRGSSAPVRFAKLLAALGPTYIKFGQILSMRKDILLRTGSRRSRPCRMSAGPGVPAVREQVETGLGGRIEELFTQPSNTNRSPPLPLRRPTARGPGTARRPSSRCSDPASRRWFARTSNLLHLVAQVLEASIDEMQLFGVVSIVEEFEQGLLQELDFHQELSNLLEFQRNLDPARKVTVPRPYPELSSRTVLTMQFFDGRPIRKLTPRSPEAKEVVTEILNSSFKQVFVDGVFHGDPHAGNLLYGSDGRVCMIDLGMVGRVSESQRDDMVTLVVATIANDMTTVARVLLKMGTATERVNLLHSRQISRRSASSTSWLRISASTIPRASSPNWRGRRAVIASGSRATWRSWQKPPRRSRTSSGRCTRRWTSSASRARTLMTSCSDGCRRSASCRTC